MKLGKTIISVFSFLVACSILEGQTIDETYLFANQNFLTGKYQQALAEFQRVAFFDYEQQYNDVYKKIGDSFFKIGEYDMAVQNYNIALRIAENDSLRIEHIFEKVKCYFQQNNYLLAINELLGAPKPTSVYLENKYQVYLATSYFGNSQYENSLNAFEKIIPVQLRPDLVNIFADFEKVQKRFDPNRIQTMSMFFPGLGQLYIGEIGPALNSILLIGGIATGSFFLWQSYGFVNAFLSTSSWYYRYYKGGYLKARKIANHKLDHEKEQVFQSILNLVENNFNQVP
jgi:tetratricopeptide (TPR) repeat protein